MSETTRPYLLSPQTPVGDSSQPRYAMHHISEECPSGNAHYQLQEVARGHLIIRAQDANCVAAAVDNTTGLALPMEPLTLAENADYTIFWLGPDEWLLLVPAKTEFEIERALRESATGHYAIVNVSGGQTLLELSGERAESMLKKTVCYDIHERNLPRGKVVTTVFAKTQGVLCRSGEDGFRIIVRRSFSDYLWQWLVDAGSRSGSI